MIDRAEKRAGRLRNEERLVEYGLAQIRPVAERLIRQFNFEGESIWDVDRRVRPEIEKELREVLTGRESEAEVATIVRQAVRDIEGRR